MSGRSPGWKHRKSVLFFLLDSPIHGESGQSQELSVWLSLTFTRKLMLQSGAVRLSEKWPLEDPKPGQRVSIESGQRARPQAIGCGSWLSERSVSSYLGE